MTWIIIAVAVFFAVSAYFTGEGNGTRSTQRYWQQIIIDCGFADWKANREGKVHFCWRTDDEVVKAIEEKKKPRKRQLGAFDE